MINIIKKTDKIDIKFVKFLFVGGLNTLVGYLLFAFFLFLGFHYSLAVLFSTILGILFNFKSTGILVFKNHNNKLIFKFFGVYSIVYVLNVSFLKIFDYFNLNLYIGGFVLLLPMAVVSYLLMKNFVFGEKKC